jgi:glycosyltransferase involved in cell wall biosynthesis
VAGTGPGGRPVKVVVMLDSIRRPGGGERLAVESAIRLDPERFERTLCLTRWEDEFELAEPGRTLLQRLSAAGVRVVGLRRRHRLDLAAWSPLVRILRRERVDVLHAHLFGSNLWASVLGRLARVPAVVAHEHMWAYSQGGLRPLIDRELISRLADAFVAVSEEGRRQMIEIERIPPGRVVLIPNGAPALKPGDGPAFRSQLAISPTAPVIASVGHLRSEKAYEVLIEATSILRERFRELVVLIAGEGEERPRLERLVDDLGLGSTVRLLGSRDDVADLLAACDLAVCCSDFEGGPLSVMEYMDAALAVVATNVGGMPELVRDRETGLLVPPRDPRSLAGAVAELLDDPKRRRGMGEAGRELRRGEYGIERWVERLESLYQELLKRASERRARRPRPPLADIRPSR